MRDADGTGLGLAAHFAVARRKLMGQQTGTEPDVLVADAQPRPTVVWFHGHSPQAIWKALFREDRLFLILSVFIGVFSGLAVVCFRFAIDWSRLYLLGTGAVLMPARILLAPTLAG